MNIGELDQVIKLHSVVETNDEGSLAQTVTKVETVFGKVTSQRGSEAFESARVNARETIRVLIRYRDDLTVKWKLEWLGQMYNIIVADRSGHRKGELWLTAQVVEAE